MSTRVMRILPKVLLKLKMLNQSWLLYSSYDFWGINHFAKFHPLCVLRYTINFGVNWGDLKLKKVGFFFSLGEVLGSKWMELRGGKFQFNTFGNMHHPNEHSCRNSNERGADKSQLKIVPKQKAKQKQGCQDYCNNKSQ